MKYDIPNILYGYSKALYSTWFFLQQDNLLFDAGEGVATSLGNQVSSIDHIFLSHGHLDHIGGLPGLINIRRAGLGNKTRPLHIYYPQGDPYVKMLIDYIEKSQENLTYEIRWIEVVEGEEIAITPQHKGRKQARRIKAFSTKHIKDQLTLGYQLIERRFRLNNRYQGYTEEEIGKLVEEGKGDDIKVPYNQILLTYAGDTTPVQKKIARGTELLMHEATFLDTSKGKTPVHSYLSSVLDLACSIGPEVLLLYHFSTRYTLEEVVDAVDAGCREREIEFAVWIQYADWLIRWEGGS